MDQKRKSFKPEESKFPFRLYEALEKASELSELTITWLPEGNGLTIHNRDAFMNILNPQYFTLKKFKSFLKQLNLYGFKKVATGVHRGSYVHEHLKRGKRDQCHLITRPKLYNILSKKEVKAKKCKSMEMKMPCSRNEDEDWQLEHAQNLFQFACLHSGGLSINYTASQSRVSVWDEHHVDHDSVIDEIVLTFQRRSV